MPTPRRILVVDDHPLFIEALRVALTPLAPLAEVAVASDLAGALVRLGERVPDLILTDLGLPDAQGVEAVARLREAAPHTPVVAISGQDDAVTVSLARALGCAGFIPKAAPLTDIQVALGVVLAGAPSFPEALSTIAQGVAALTPAQARILAAAATGKLNKQIAYEMNLAEPTVKSHMSAIFKRLGVSNRTQAVLALNDGRKV